MKLSRTYNRKKLELTSFYNLIDHISQLSGEKYSSSYSIEVENDEYTFDTIEELKSKIHLKYKYIGANIYWKGVAFAYNYFSNHKTKIEIKGHKELIDSVIELLDESIFVEEKEDAPSNSLQKGKTFKGVFIDRRDIKSLLEEHFKDGQYSTLKTKRNNERWEFGNLNDFLSYYDKECDEFSINVSTSKVSLWLDSHSRFELVVIVRSTFAHLVRSIFSEVESLVSKSHVEISKDIAKDKIVVFIGHGGNKQWRELKDHLSDLHNIKVEAFESGARAGHHIRDILEDMSTKSTFAIMVMTGEDETKDGKMRARQNVIHEIGLFQGKLGFNRAIVAMENDTEEFSNINGVQQLRFSKNNIKEIFGDVVATIKREFD
ncbi:Predicted nucleotide-binding protein containing TIR-like domain-containing protein [Catalinimonas alkaloidigena]|uniref:Predicted nucleotide-binding protein containing TIR-like domain-containing protein n=1 Tax=Catalinimonas alkaloidigena TaxID=1075417 RepID=A0A1G9BV43_9BACT|nr:nucleotide-binding protein [Catalinimonas alkaloidigena]SDK43332.1 Predicted nucleotide-binding protein containing TIR-like domain-containing protein [Catalinimonas alkaloidigena]